ncbi:di-heme oxidoredictase family protein [Mucilaginibacter pedocola]|uniref:Thiol oxidoreductase n=1 Tax=Mucilaginibacter pedocola TaxID=1792845 RepID=A0A1S9P8S5_9SPHI|nr:di-heme oxidoredictase family protein [Mucilaginibacter pedocola]OOQ57342.1 thiol oxidoreductase [Mucilaginibacter pedocola]
MKLRLIFPLLLLSACTKLQPAGPKADQVLDGPLENLTPEQRLQFLRGDIAFNDEVFTRETGLGPLFVSTSCGSCHAGDGKGHPFTTLTRFGQTDVGGNQYLQSGGPQLQHRALQGFEPEQIPAGATFSRFMPPANTGLGLLDAVADSSILAMADPMDRDSDGISGEVSWISPKKYSQQRPGGISQNGKVIGRFGKKAAAYDLLHQTAVAYNEDIGITSVFEPISTYNGEEGDPEIASQTVLDVVFYLKTLKAPIQRNASTKDVVDGRALFISAKCGTCHRPELKTGYSPINALSQISFYPYTDLLLHDMGSTLNDGYTEGGAKTFEWRTPPLWGLGLSKNSQGGGYFLLHDGRAKSINEAILLHGGEATRSRNNYQALSEAERKKVLIFLESL